MPRGVPTPYDHHWRRLAKLVRAEAGGRCEVCGAPASSADHVVPVSERPDLRLVRSNVRATCARHNMGRVSGRLARMAQINRDARVRREW